MDTGQSMTATRYLPRILMKPNTVPRNPQTPRPTFKKQMLALMVVLACAPGARAAISVGPAGSGTIIFDTLPAAADWSTITNTGAHGDIVDAAGLDAAVQTNVASAITMQVGSTATTAPAISSAGIARLNSAL